MAKEMAIREQNLDFREYKENPAEELKWGRAKAVLTDIGSLYLKQKGKFDLSVQSTLIQIPGSKVTGPFPPTKGQKKNSFRIQVGEKTTEFGAENSSEWVNELKTFVDKPVVLQSPRQVMTNSGGGSLNKTRSTKVSSVLKRGKKQGEKGTGGVGYESMRDDLDEDISDEESSVADQGKGLKKSKSQILLAGEAAEKETKEKRDRDSQGNSKKEKTGSGSDRMKSISHISSKLQQTLGVSPKKGTPREAAVIVKVGNILDDPLPKVPTISFPEIIEVSSLSSSESFHEEAVAKLDVSETKAGETLTSAQKEDKPANKEEKVVKELSPEEQQESDRVRKNIVMELYQTELTYIHNLKGIKSWYFEPLLGCCESLGVSKDNINKIFGPSLFQVILGYHGKISNGLETLSKEWNPQTTMVGKIFKTFAPFFKIYGDYSTKYSEGMDIYQNLMDSNKLFTAKVQELRDVSGQTHQVPDILIMPIQRIPRYSLLLNDLLKHTSPAHVDYQDLADACAAIQTSANLLNETLRDHLKVKSANNWIEQMQEKGLEIFNEKFVNSSRKMRKEGIVRHKLLPCEYFGKPTKETTQFILFNDLFLHIKKDLLKQQLDLNQPQYLWSLSLVWVEKHKDDTVLIIGPNETYVLTNADDWFQALTEQIDIFLKHKNKALKANTQQYTADIRRAKYDFPNASKDERFGTYMGYWKNGNRHGRGTWVQKTKDLKGKLDCEFKIRGYWANNKPQGKNEIKFFTGGTFVGATNLGLPDGYGTFYKPDGTKYSGYWANGERNGKGKLTFSDSSYHGEWSKGIIQGKGIMSFKDGSQYIGEVTSFLFNGLGKFSNSNGIVYEGYWSNGLRHGRGCLNYPNGDKLIGDFVNGVLNGRVLVTLASGVTFDGIFVNGKKEGSGKWVGGTKKSYDGLWFNDQRWGKGKMLFPNGDLNYDGDWMQDRPHGEGEYIDICKARYVGSIRKGNKHGKGELTLPDGSTCIGQFAKGKICKGNIFTTSNNIQHATNIRSYDGEWENNKMTGKSLIKYCNGDTYKGNVTNGVLHGNGQYTFCNGYQLSGKWENGVKKNKFSLTHDNKTITGNIVDNVLTPSVGFAIPIPPTWSPLPFFQPPDTIYEEMTR